VTSKPRNNSGEDISELHSSGIFSGNATTGWFERKERNLHTKNRISLAIDQEFGRLSTICQISFTQANFNLILLFVFLLQEFSLRTALKSSPNMESHT